MKKDEIPTIVTKRQLADFIGISERRITQLQQDHILARNNEAGGFDLKQCTRQYWEYKLDSETNRKTAISKEQVQAEHEQVKMEISKLKLRRLRRESLDIRAVEACWASFLTYFIGKLDSLGSKIIMAAAGAEVNEQLKIADGIIADMKEELREFDPTEVDDSVAFDDDLDDEDEDDEGDD